MTANSTTRIDRTIQRVLHNVKYFSIGSGFRDAPGVFVARALVACRADTRVGACPRLPDDRNRLLLWRLRFDVAADHPAQAREEQQRQSAPRRKRAESRVAQVADLRCGRRQQCCRRQNQKHDGACEKNSGQSLSRHRVTGEGKGRRVRCARWKTRS